MKSQYLYLFVFVVTFSNYCGADDKCPNPPINCLRCIDSCPENETLVISPCGCCHNKCVPKRRQSILCPQKKIACKRCIESCPENEILVRSPCGCCYNKCVPEVPCEDPPIQCFVCHWSCPENETLVVSPCGCCYNKCVPDKPQCVPNICHIIRCALPTCEPGYILAEGEGYCGCCPGCVKPVIGGRCYKELNTELQSCGPDLKCCNGKCVLKTALCLNCS